MRPILKTRRLLLRDFCEDDWRAVHEYASDPRVVRHMIWGPNTVRQTKRFIREILASQRKKPRDEFELAVIRRSDNLLLGGCGIRIKSFTNRDGDIGYVFRRDVWGQGYATEAARAVLDYGFRRLKLHRIWATCDVKNKGSARVLEKIGMTREGRLRKNVRMRGSWRDSYLYAVVKSNR